MYFKKKKINSKTLGERLKKIREELEITLDEIARGTKVKKKYLQMIEEDQFDKLPGGIYARGFLVSYAQYLDIEPEDVLALHEKEEGIRNNLQEKKKKKESPQRFLKMPLLILSPRLVLITAILALLGLGGVYFYREIDHFSQAPQLIVQEPVSNSQTDQDKVRVLGSVDKNSRVSINGQAVPVTEWGEFEQEVTLHNGMNELNVRAVNRFGNEIENKIIVQSNFEEILAQQAQEEEQENTEVAGVQDQKVTLQIQTEEPVWLEVKADGEIKHTGKVLNGTQLIFEAEEVILLTSAKADKTLIKFDSEEYVKLDPDTPGIITDIAFASKEEVIEKLREEKAEVWEPKPGEEESEEDEEEPADAESSGEAEGGGEDKIGEIPEEPEEKTNDLNSQAE